jgi:hypothetical protein
MRPLTQQEVLKWLDAMGFAKYKPIFLQNEVTGLYVRVYKGIYQYLA